MFVERYGPCAVIAGGSDGIGAAFARAAAKRGLDLVLIARNEGTLSSLAQEIEKEHPKVMIRTLAVDLSSPSAAKAIESATEDLDVGLFIFNVGSEPSYGPFLEHDEEWVNQRMNRNFVVKAQLTHHFGRRMVARGRGGIILMGSMSGYFGSPGFALYSASKAYTRYLAEGLWHELKAHNIDLLCPVVGPTVTPTMIRSYGKLEGAADPADVAETALDKIADGPVWVSEEIAGQVAAMEAMPPAERSKLAAHWGEEFAKKGIKPTSA
ncbi:SDR family NAD(P)-dependent oxidoreductase [Rhizorhabdus argentea]|uniref:SDR family NAD(P)-dependent oxidoreductase n=1 Tax=Rhizorhabdus argentea TaxID=1387174 RepID=UPI0030EEC634